MVRDCLRLKISPVKVEGIESREQVFLIEENLRVLTKALGIFPLLKLDFEKLMC